MRKFSFILQNDLTAKEKSPKIHSLWILVWLTILGGASLARAESPIGALLEKIQAETKECKQTLALKEAAATAILHQNPDCFRSDSSATDNTSCEKAQSDFQEGFFSYYDYLNKAAPQINTDEENLNHLFRHDGSEGTFWHSPAFAAENIYRDSFGHFNADLQKALANFKTKERKEAASLLKDIFSFLTSAETVTQFVASLQAAAEKVESLRTQNPKLFQE